MILRYFNEDGENQFLAFLKGHIDRESRRKLRKELEEDSLTKRIFPEVELLKTGFDNRLQLGLYLNELVEKTGQPELESNRAFWSWVSAYLFPMLCPEEEGIGPGQIARWIPDTDNFQTYYRHLLAGPYFVVKHYRADPYKAFAILANEPHRPGDIAEQLASRQNLVTNETVLEVATRLYIDRGTAKPKVGAAGRGRGSVTRLISTLRQLDLIWDLYYLHPDELMELLPPEFERFKA